MDNQMSDYYIEGSLPSTEDPLQRIPSDPLDLLASRPTHAPVSKILHAGNGAMRLQLSAEEQNTMMKSIQDIFELEEEQPKEDVEMGESGEEEEAVDLEDQSRRTERLKGVLSTLAQLWWSDSEHMDLVAEKLGDGSRDRKLDALSFSNQTLYAFLAWFLRRYIKLSLCFSILHSPPHSVTPSSF